MRRFGIGQNRIGIEKDSTEQIERGYARICLDGPISPRPRRSPRFTHRVMARNLIQNTDRATDKTFGSPSPEDPSSRPGQVSRPGSLGFPTQPISQYHQSITQDKTATACQRSPAAFWLATARLPATRQSVGHWPALMALPLLSLHAFTDPEPPYQYPLHTLTPGYTPICGSHRWHMASAVP